MKGRLFMILVFIIIAFMSIMILGSVIRNDLTQKFLSKYEQQHITIKNEVSVFEKSNAVFYNDKTIGQRRIAQYYDNRAYPGAPPTITHPVLANEGIGANECLQCHQIGGYVEQFGAFAPITPHADWLSCRQCHVPSRTVGIFTNTNWIKPDPPPLGTRAMLTSPQVIPHQIVGRENCLSCHAGPGAPVEIRVSHSERSNCLQCHVSAASTNDFNQLKSSHIGLTFSRSDSIYKYQSLDENKVRNIKEWIQQ